MTLRQKQSEFALALGKFIVWIYRQGYELTMGEGQRDDKQGHMAGSLHYVRLAQDLNLFVDGRYITSSDHPVYAKLGVKWKSLHPLARWGGDFKNRDANHFSFTHGGKA